MLAKRTRVLIIDDSAAMRQLLTKILSSDHTIEVVGVAQDPFVAREKIKALNPDVITLDVEMPRMDGITFLEKLMRARPMPVVMVSSLTQKGCDITLRALELGAVDYVSKPTIDTLTGIGNCAQEIVEKVKAAASAQIVTQVRSTVRADLLAASQKSSLGAASFRLTNQIIAIGASTGGTEALKDVLIPMPADSPGIVMVLHMPAGFTFHYAERLNSLCAVHVKEAEDGDRIVPGHALLAPGGRHMCVSRSGAEYFVELNDEPLMSGHRPSVNRLFNSCAEHVGPNAVAAILTGMGGDGASGLRLMRDAGARTIAQNEASCVVFGMPKEAIASGGAEQILPLSQIGAELIALARQPRKAVV